MSPFFQNLLNDSIRFGIPVTFALGMSSPSMMKKLTKGTEPHLGHFLMLGLAGFMIGSMAQQGIFYALDHIGNKALPTSTTTLTESAV